MESISVTNQKLQTQQLNLEANGVATSGFKTRKADLGLRKAFLLLKDVEE